MGGGKSEKKSSRHSFYSSSSSRSRCSNQSLKESLHPIQQAKLDEKLKGMELEEFHKQQEEKEQAETYYRKMDDQAWEASWSREALTTRLSRARTLRQLERKHAEAKLISSLLQEGTTDVDGQRGKTDDIPNSHPQALPLSSVNGAEGGFLPSPGSKRCSAQYSDEEESAVLPSQPRVFTSAPPVTQTLYPTMQQNPTAHLLPSSSPQPIYFPPQHPSQSSLGVSYYPPDAAGTQLAS